MSEPLKIGLAGFSGFGSQDHQSTMYAPALLAAADAVSPAAVAILDEGERPRAEALAERLGVEVVDYATLLADESVAAICLAAPPERRADAVIAAIRAGKHVLADKPLAPTADEVARIVAAHEELPADQTPVVAVAHHQRFNAKLVPLAGALAAGRIGLPWQIQGDFVVAGGDPIPGGELVNFGLYAVDNLLHLTGQPVIRVHAHAVGEGEDVATGGDADGAVPPRSLFALHLDHGSEDDWGEPGTVRLTSTMVVGRTGPRVGLAPGAVSTHRYRIAGSHGTITMDDADDGIRVHTATTEEHHSVDPGTVHRLVRGWLGAISGRTAPAVGPRQALAVARVLDAAAQALESGQPVALDR